MTGDNDFLPGKKCGRLITRFSAASRRVSRVFGYSWNEKKRKKGKEREKTRIDLRFWA